MPGTWKLETVGGHPCDVYYPPERNKHGYVVLYLHGVHLNRLHDIAAFIEQFDRHGLAVVAPHTKRRWWNDKGCLHFDLRISAQRHVADNVLLVIETKVGAKPPRTG